MSTISVPADISPAAHIATVARRTADGGSFFPVGPGDFVSPLEPIRLVATGVDFQSFNEPEFVIKNAQGNTVFRVKKNASTFTGIATVDISAPGLPGDYELTIHAQSFPFLPTTHSSKTLFRVATTVPPPMPPPPEEDGFFEDIGGGLENTFKPIKGLLWAGGFLLLGIATVLVVPKLVRK